MTICVIILLTAAEMHELTEIVVPNVKANWESLAFCMRYNPREVEAFRKDSQDLKECCMKLFTNWLETGHGPTPKTYQTLLNHIKKLKIFQLHQKKLKESWSKVKQASKQNNC